MQGKKNYTERLFVNFQLSQHVSKNNFYRRLKEVLDLDFLYKQTKKYYGDCGQKSIDPIVFKKKHIKLTHKKVESMAKGKKSLAFIKSVLYYTLSKE